MTASSVVHMSGYVSSSRWRPDRQAVARDRTTARVPVRRPEGCCRAASAPRRPEGGCGAGRLATDGRSRAQQRAQFVVTVVSLTPVPAEPSCPQLIVTGSDATSSWGLPLNRQRRRDPCSAPRNGRPSNGRPYRKPASVIDDRLDQTGARSTGPPLTPADLAGSGPAARLRDPSHHAGRAGHDGGRGASCGPTDRRRPAA